MKPDGVDAATMEPMVALDAEPAVEVAPLGEGQEQAPPTSQTEEAGQGEPQPTETPTAATKTGKDKTAELKAKTKAGPTKTKTPTTKTSTGGSRPTTTQSRLTNGVQKTQTNGVAKKTPGVGPEKKNTSTTAPSRKPAGTVTTKAAPKTTEKKPVGTTRPATAPASAARTTGTTQAAKKNPAAPVNGDKAKPKTTAPRPASAATTRPGTTSSPKTDRPPVSKTTRPATGTTASRPASAAPKPTASATSKTSTSASKPSLSTAKTSTSAAKPSPAKTTAPPAGRTPGQSSKTTTPIKKDVSKPTTPAAKKPAASPLTRPASTKPIKPDTPKAATPAKLESKKPSGPSKAAGDAKTSKPKDTKSASSKEVTASPKTPNAKSSAAKMTSPKKTVGSSTPMPVKRGPKAAAAEPAPKETTSSAVETTPSVNAVATATAVAAATAAAVVTAATAADAFTTEATNESEVHIESVSLLPEAKSEIALEPSSELKLDTKFELTAEPQSDILLETECELPTEPKNEVLIETVSEVVPEPKSELAPEHQAEVLWATESELPFEAKTELTHEPHSEVLWATESEIAPEPKSEIAPEPHSEVLWATESELPPEPKSELTSEPQSEVLWATESEIAPEPKSEIAPEPQSEVLWATESELTTELKTELAPEPKTEVLWAAESEDAPEPKTEVLWATESEIVPESKSELATEPRPEVSLEAESEYKPKPFPEITFEPTTVPSVPAAIKDFMQDSEDDEQYVPEDTAEAAEDTMPQLADELDLVSLKEPAGPTSPLGTTVMSPPSSPLPQETQNSAPLLDMHAPVNPWAESQSMFSGAQEQEGIMAHEDFITTTEPAEEEPKPEVEEKSFSLGVEPNLLSTSPLEHFSGASPTTPDFEKEEAVEKAEEEINEDDHEEEELEEEEEVEEEEEEEEEEEDKVVEFEKPETFFQKQQTDDYNVGQPELGGSSWDTVHSDNAGSFGHLDKADSTTTPLNLTDRCNDKCADEVSLQNDEKTMESHQFEEDVDDFSLKKVETEQPFMGPPGLKSFSDEEEEEEEDDEPFKRHMGIVSEQTDKHDHMMAMDVGFEQADSHCAAVEHPFKFQEEEEREDEDVEMVSEGLIESGSKTSGNVDEDVDDYGVEDYMDNKNCTAPAPSMPTTTAWGPSNPFADTWAQPASIHMTSSPLEIEIGTADPEMPRKSPAEAWLEQPLGKFAELHEEMEGSVPVVDSSNLGVPAVGMSQSSTLSGAALAAHSSSETSTPEELRDYDSSSGVESRSDKQQTPVPTCQPDLEQDLGIHLERGDGEEEEAETLPADEVLGDAPTAPASAPSSPSTSGDEASDTEGEMQINDPDAPVDDSAAFDGSSAPRNLPALDEDEEAGDMHVGEEDGGGGTPQSANSVASYGFDCSASNSNAHSTAESCGKSPGIFSLENEDQLPEEAKDPSLIKELTLLPAASAQPQELLGCPVDLLPLGQQGELESHIDLDDEYLLCGKTAASALEDEADPDSPMHLSPQHGGSTDSQPPYYSAICDKTDSFLAGNV